MTNSLPAAASLPGDIQITAIKALQPRSGSTKSDTTLVRVETNTGAYGIGPCHGSGPFVRAVLDRLEGPRLPHLTLIGNYPLSIDVHFHNLFYAYPQRARVMGVLSAIDIALWDLAGKLLGQPVCRPLGGPNLAILPLSVAIRLMMKRKMGR